MDVYVIVEQLGHENITHIRAVEFDLDAAKKHLEVDGVEPHWFTNSSGMRNRNHPQPGMLTIVPRTVGVTYSLSDQIRKLIEQQSN